MNLTLFLNQYSTVILLLFLVGCSLAWFNEKRKLKGSKPSKGLKLGEWILLVPGFARIFIFLHEKSVPALVSHTGIALTVLLVAIALSVVLIALKKKKPGLMTTYLAGLVGTPLLVFALILLGQFIVFQDRFEELKTTYSKLESIEGLSAPDFEFAVVGSDEPGHLRDYRGKLLLVNVWATWCGPCLFEMPALERLQQQYRSQGLVVLNLSDEPEEVIQQYLQKNPMSTVHGRVPNRQSVPEFYQFGKGRPTTFVIDSQGMVVETLSGGKSYRVFEGVITKHL